MRPLVLSLPIATFFAAFAFFLVPTRAFGDPQNSFIAGVSAMHFRADAGSNATLGEEDNKPPIAIPSGSSRTLVLVASLTVFVLSVFVGFEIIAKVPPTLHTPLMSGSNAISGITVVGAIIAAGYKETGVGSLLGFVAIVLAMINVVGGFLVTHRMLLMFKKR